LQEFEVFWERILKGLGIFFIICEVYEVLEVLGGVILASFEGFLGG
jgi:hypothetical protein